MNVYCINDYIVKGKPGFRFQIVISKEGPKGLLIKKIIGMGILV